MTARDLKAIRDDASERQRAAADPLTSAWVAASAGTGKTRVLTNRFLRLLLLGEPPDSLLALTFTKAAAAEMANRISEELEKWAQLDDDELHKMLTALMNRAPSTEEYSRARLLFTQSLALPQGFNIQTIHSFCGSLLQRFPIEAGLAPDSRQIDEHGAKALLGEVLANIATKLTPSDPVRGALDRILIKLTPEALSELLAHTVSERARISEAIRAANGLAGVTARLAAYFAIPESIATHPNPEHELTQSVLRPSASRREKLARLNEHLATSTKSQAEKIKNGLSMLLLDQDADWRDYTSCLLNQDGSEPKRLIQEITKFPEIEAIYLAEVKLLIDVDQQLRAVRILSMNRDFLLLASKVIDDLDRLKRTRNMIDFDDMILMAAKLLGAGRDVGATQWVQYKLDQGIRHLLVDEAQDTNPDQWRVIQAMSDEFFAGEGTRSATGLDRTLFVVGDLKQSIYGFQRADPKLFKRGREQFRHKASLAGKTWIDQPLTTTFRCAPAILDTVNAVFTQPGMAEGLSFDDQEGWAVHSSGRENDYGQVILHPPLIKPKPTRGDDWLSEADGLPEPINTFDATQELAARIAADVAHWTAIHPKADDPGQWLSRPDQSPRRVTPGDILILLKKRGALADKLISNLQSLGVPVAGADRLRLLDQLVIKDLLVLADASLQPADDLAVATVLRSPLACIDDTLLEDLAYRRKDDGLSLMAALEADGTQIRAIDFLRQCQTFAATLPAYEFFAAVLYGQIAYDATGNERLLSRLGDEINDPIHELLAQARLFETDHPATLQKFLVWIRTRDESIKRDLETDGSKEDADDTAGSSDTIGQVRVMTAHASKGLEAPVVIFGDAYQQGTQRFASKLIWADAEKPALPIWAPSSNDDIKLTTQIKEQIKRAQSLEDRRLLYVAMTRAEERLHIYGLRRDSATATQAGWYKAIETGLASLVEPSDILLHDYGDGIEWRGVQYRLQTGVLPLPQTVAESKDLVPQKPESLETPSLPTWAGMLAKPEPTPTRPLSPSQLDPDGEQQLSTVSPIDRSIKSRFLRGTLIHSLFKVLPQIAPQQRHETARMLLTKPHDALSKTDIDDIIEKVLGILENRDYADLFGSTSKAEVPLSGIVDGVPIAGQVDRLVEITNQRGGVSEVLVVDYKTNRPPPKTPANMPTVYRLQMSAYAKILAQIYPDASIRPFVLWTETAHLMEIKAWQSVKIPGSVDASPRQLDLM